MPKDPIDAQNRRDLDPLSESDEITLDDESEQEDVFQAREQHATVARSTDQDDGLWYGKIRSGIVHFKIAQRKTP